MKCSKCKFECDAADAFCRKCGSAMIIEVEAIPLKAKAVEIEIVPIGEEIPMEISPKGKAFSLAGQLGAKLANVLKTEQGQKLTKGATSLAVAVGVEMMNQAVNKLTKTTDPADAKLSTGDKFVKAVEKKLDAKDGTVVEEVYEEHWYSHKRKVTRKKESKG